MQKHCCRTWKATTDIVQLHPFLVSPANKSWVLKPASCVDCGTAGARFCALQDESCTAPISDSKRRVSHPADAQGGRKIVVLVLGVLPVGIPSRALQVLATLSTDSTLLSLVFVLIPLELEIRVTGTGLDELWTSLLHMNTIRRWHHTVFEGPSLVDASGAWLR